jgi:O-antigen/teichoic acid export membrane protein
VGVDILPLVLLANILAGVWLNLSFWYKREEKTKYALYITLLGLVVTIGLSFALVPKMGYKGAAIVRLIAEAVMVVWSYTLCRKHYPIPYDLKRMGEYVVLGGVIYLAGEYALAPLTTAPRMAMNTMLLMVVVAYAVWRERIDLKAMLRAMLSKVRR